MKVAVALGAAAVACGVFAAEAITDVEVMATVEGMKDDENS